MINSYTSFFIAVPIPDEYIFSFAQLVNEINNSFPEIPTVNPTTPHLTLYYLTQEAQDDLNYIKSRVEEIKNILENNTVKIGGFNCFGKELPRVLFLNVGYPTSLNSFNQQLATSLKKYSAEDNGLGFYPHVTVASVKDPKAQEIFQAHRSRIETLFNGIRWTFPITEIIIYGANSKIQPELQNPISKIVI
ncbi:MAG: RNA 2',3'-cyclic phosphodiesterase [Patescibacteria group bacterium]